MSVHHDRPKPLANYIDWLIVALSAFSATTYFVTSLGARGQVIFLIKAAVKVLARLGIHS
jgi:hypothetical protein